MSVAHVDTDTVSFVELRRFQVFRVVPVGAAPVSLRADSSAGLVYVANRLSDTVSVIDTTVFAVLDTFNVGRVPTALELSPARRELYVANGFFEAQEGNSISILDTDTGNVLEVIPAIFDPLVLALSQTGDELYVGGLALREVLVVDISARDVVAEIDISGNSSDIVLSPDGSKLYAVGTGVNERTVSLIDLSTMEVAEEVAVDEATFGAISKDGSQLYVSGFSPTVSILDAADLSVLDTFDVDGTAGILRVSPDGAFLAVAHLDRDAVTIVDPTSGGLLDVVSLKGRPRDIAFFECEPLCPGDCDRDRRVSVAELVRAVNLAIRDDPPDPCLSADIDGDRRISISELIRAVDNALHGCP